MKHLLDHLHDIRELDIFRIYRNNTGDYIFDLKDTCWRLEYRGFTNTLGSFTFFGKWLYYLGDRSWVESSFQQLMDDPEVKNRIKEKMLYHLDLFDVSPYKQLIIEQEKKCPNQTMSVWERLSSLLMTS